MQFIINWGYREKVTGYDTLCRKLGLQLTGDYGAASDKLPKTSDEAIESLLPAMTARGQLGYLDTLPYS